MRRPQSGRRCGSRRARASRKARPLKILSRKPNPSHDEESGSRLQTRLMDEANDPLIERSKQRVGHTLKDKWRLDELIGVGGMAAVYSATHCKNGKRVAVKMLHAELAVGSSEIRGRFLREGRAANTGDHPGAPQIMDGDEREAGRGFLVRELLHGRTPTHPFDGKARPTRIA